MKFSLRFVAAFYISCVFFVRQTTANAKDDFDNFARTLITKISSNNVLYLFVDCEAEILRVIRSTFDEIAGSKYSINTNVNVITIPIDERVGRPWMFTKNIRQLRDALENYACEATIVQEFQNRHISPKGMYQTILQNIDQMHENDAILIFLGDKHERFFIPAMEFVKYKGVLTNIVWTENSPIPNTYVQLARQTRGHIISKTTTNMESYRTKTTLENDLDFEKSTIQKSLRENTRTTIDLPLKTAKITLQLRGQIRKALLTSPSGITINVTPDMPTNDSFTMRETNNYGISSGITFATPIVESPATWTLSANGEQYDLTINTFVQNRGGYIDDPSPIDSRWRNYEYGRFDVHQKNNMQLLNKTNTTYFDSESLVKRQDNDESIASIPVQGMARMDDPNLLINSRMSVIPTTIDVDALSAFYAYPGEEARLVFNVQNNKPFATLYNFHCWYLQKPCFVQPIKSHLIPQQRVQVTVIVRAEGSEGSSNIISFESRSDEISGKRAYLFVGRQKSDTRKPDIGYEYNGNCDDADTGSTCHLKKWSANLVAQDSDSGLLNFWSEPFGLIYTTDFVVGTKDPVSARYSASCCDPKVDIVATDLRGNTHKVTLNVEHQWLSAIEIIAIILGIILIVLSIAAIIYLVVRWRKKRNETSFLG